MAKSKNAVKSVLFPKNHSNEKAPKFNQIIEVEDDFVTDFDITLEQITELVAKLETALCLTIIEDAYNMKVKEKEKKI